MRRTYGVIVVESSEEHLEDLQEELEEIPEGIALHILEGNL